MQIELTEEDVQFLNQILGSVEVNGTRVALNGLVQCLQKLNTPAPEETDNPLTRE